MHNTKCSGIGMTRCTALDLLQYSKVRIANILNCFLLFFAGRTLFEKVRFKVARYDGIAMLEMKATERQ